MSCYYYQIINEQVVIKKGLIIAKNNFAAINKFREKILPKIKNYTEVGLVEVKSSEIPFITNESHYVDHVGV